jgi:uncharacterized membrane protein YadS
VLPSPATLVFLLVLLRLTIKVKEEHGEMRTSAYNKKLTPYFIFLYVNHLIHPMVNIGSAGK